MYDHKEIDGKWQRYWEDKGIYRADGLSGKPKKFILIEFPYPSGEGLHMGHLRPYVAGDVYSRFCRMNGYETMYPIGWDAFGLPAENFAIRKGVHPRVSTAKNIENAKRQVMSWGIGFDWSREINTTDPEYYKWTQWIFLKFFKAGLAFESTGTINWCPKDKTGLANEEVINGCCERCGTPVEKKDLRQWYLKITAYAEKLLEGLKDLQWPVPVKLQQQNWIGKSEGAHIDFEVANAKRGNCVLLHGYSGSPEKHIFPWLKGELQARGFSVDAPSLPNPGDPIVSDQVKTVLNSSTITEDTVLVGHSLGGVVALKTLEHLKKPVKKTVLICSYMENRFLNDEPFDEHVFDWRFDFEKIRRNSGEVVILRDLTDNIVPKDQADKLARLLGGRIVDFNANGPHAWSEQEPAVLKNILTSIRVFTTRPDTLFGATYLVLAPEHPLVDEIASPGQIQAVEEYQASAKKKSEVERTNADKDKTGVFSGAYATNPATGEQIPVWIADYVLTGYGTGAIMAVPAHDERDYDFAKRFSLPIKQVIEPCLTQSAGEDAVKPDLPFVHREAVMAIVKNPKDGKYLGLKWKRVGWQSFVTGGIENGQSAEEAARREVLEETGFKNLKLVKDFPYLIHGKFYHLTKNENRFAHFHAFLFELADKEMAEVVAEEKDRHEIVWLDENEVGNFLTAGCSKHAWQYLTQNEAVYVGDGILVNSGEFSGLEVEEAIPRMGKRFGEMTVQYKLRDWVFSRQRYWGEPIPIVHCDACGAVPVPEQQLPVLLPEVEKYEPTGTGESPLANISEWVNTACPSCGGSAKRETNTMPQWAGSSWYFLRYCDPRNDQAFASIKALSRWMPVDVYFGGMEHTTLHLLYSRFWNLFLHDQGLVPFPEPYAKRVPHGIILASDGEKMSKSRGNVVNPDEINQKFGADSLRMYELFLGPHETMVSWNDQGVSGVKRFLDRVHKFAADFKPGPDKREIHRLIKKVTADIGNFKFNTIIAAFMEFLNENKEMSSADWEAFLKLLAPFAPHTAEELWHKLGHKDSIHLEDWPNFDEAKAAAKEVAVVIQILGRVRATITVPAGASEESVVEKALSEENVKRHLQGKEIVKKVFVPDRLVNFVVK